MLLSVAIFPVFFVDVMQVVNLLVIVSAVMHIKLVHVYFKCHVIVKQHQFYVMQCNLV
jgi:hypothetical protein